MQAWNARLAPASVVVEGSLRVDPRAEADRWSAVLDVGLVGWSGRAAAIHESVWLSGQDEPPDAVRGDRVRVSGTLGVSEDVGFGEFLLRRGIAAELRVSEAERLGPASFAPIRWAQWVDFWEREGRRTQESHLPEAFRTRNSASRAG